MPSTVAGASLAQVIGSVSAPAAGDTTRYLRSDLTWQVPSVVVAPDLLAVPFLSSTTTLTSQPTADTELPAVNYRLLLDLAAYTQVRASLRVATIGASTADLRFQYATTDAGTYANLTPELSLAALGEVNTGWQSLPVAARANDIRIRMMGKEGTTLSPVVRQVILQFK